MINEILVIAVAVAAIFLIGLVVYSRRQYKKYDALRLKNVIVAERDKATYYRGKPAEPVPQSLRVKVYKRDGYECQQCGDKVLNGHATTKAEFLWGLMGSVPGNIHHRYIPASYGGPAVLENLETTCHACNIALGDDVITQESFRFLAKRGETIYLGKENVQ